MTHYFQGLLERECITFPSSIAAGADLLNDPIHQAKDHNYASSFNPSFMPCSHNIKQDQPRIVEVCWFTLHEIFLIYVYITQPQLILEPCER